MDMKMKIYFDNYYKIIEGGIERLLDSYESNSEKLVEGIRYALVGGGKRIRGILLMATAEMYGVSIDTALPFAIALELIHGYSLVHDDMPCMDNDSMRRGKPTVHKAFGEDVALLIGDAMLNLANEILLEEILKDNAEIKAKAAFELLKAAGCKGMLAGQMLDKEAEGRHIDLSQLKRLYRNKTGALIIAPLVIGGILGKASDSDLNNLRQYGDAIGMAFQINDDILDVVGNQELFGKDLGSDEENEKNTFVRLLGLDEALEQVQNYTNKAISSIQNISMKEPAKNKNNYNSIGVEFFVELASYLAKRKK